MTALRGWTNIQNTDYDIEDYISDGSNRKSFKGAWQPRLGFSYDLFADQRHVIFGGAGRSYDRNLFDYIALEQSKSTFPSYTVSFFDAPQLPATTGLCDAWPDLRSLGSGVFQPGEPVCTGRGQSGARSEVNLINNDIDVPYSDQFSLGMRNSFELMGNDWNTSASIVAHQELRRHHLPAGQSLSRWHVSTARDGPWRCAVRQSDPWLRLVDQGRQWRRNADEPVPALGRQAVQQRVRHGA